MTTYIELRERLIELRKTMKWREIALLPDFHGLPIGTISNLIYREPKSPIIRERLGLPQHKSCGMCYVFNRYIKKATRKPRKIFDMPTRQLRIAFINREEM
jgi:hypothetical protein